MKNLLYILPSLLLVAVSGLAVGCRFATSCREGDTVVASAFEPADTTAAARHAVADTLRRGIAPMADSVGMYYVGTGSTKQFLQLVSYPSRRDTLVYGKTRHIKVTGSADYNNVVRVRFYLLNGRDSLVCAVEQVVP